MVVASLRRLFEHRSDIASVEIFHIESYLTTRIPLAPSELETHRYAEKTVVSDPAAIDAILTQLEAADAKPAHAETEYRWKLAFANASGARMLEIYAAAFAPLGAIGETSVAFKDDALPKWLQATYAPSELETPV